MSTFCGSPPITIKRSPSEIPHVNTRLYQHHPPPLSSTPRSMANYYTSGEEFPDVENGHPEASDPGSLPPLNDLWYPPNAFPSDSRVEERRDERVLPYSATYPDTQWNMPAASTSSYSSVAAPPSAQHHFGQQMYDTAREHSYYSYSQPNSSLQLALPQQNISPHAYTHSLPPTPSQLYTSARHSPTSLPSDHSPRPRRTASTSPYGASPLLADTPVPGSSSSMVLANQAGLTHKEQLQKFKQAVIDFRGPTSVATGPFVQQNMYKPHTSSDRRRYVEEITMEEPIVFHVESPNEVGIPLSDALHMRVRRLVGRDETVFQGRGPSVSVRLEWPGYRPWSRQIPTKDFRSPPGPITRAKLAKNVAKCVQRFISERQGMAMEDDGDPKWRVGTAHGTIRIDDLVLVSLHHVSMGSWQPHLRLRRPLPS